MKEGLKTVVQGNDQTTTKRGLSSPDEVGEPKKTKPKSEPIVMKKYGFDWKQPDPVDGPPELNDVVFLASSGKVVEGHVITVKDKIFYVKNKISNEKIECKYDEHLWAYEKPKKISILSGVGSLSGGNKDQRNRQHGRKSVG